MISRILNFSELSRYITGGDRNCIRANKVPKKWHNRIDQLIYKELPKYWEEIKEQGALSNPKNGFLHHVTFETYDELILCEGIHEFNIKFFQVESDAVISELTVNGKHLTYLSDFWTNGCELKKGEMYFFKNDQWVTGVTIERGSIRACCNKTPKRQQP